MEYSMASCFIEHLKRSHKNNETDPAESIRTFSNTGITK
jgi:hypothetical protein